MNVKFLERIEPWRRTLWIMFGAQLVTAVGFSIIFPFLSLYVTELGSSTRLSVEFLAGAVFSAQALTMMIASPVWGAVADKYGRKLMVERAMFGGTILLLLMGFVQNAEQLVLLRAIQGLVTGTVVASNALVAGVVPRERMGFAMGLLLVGQTGGVAVGPLIGGAMADSVGYRYTFVLTALLLLAAGILVYFGVEEKPFNREETAVRRINFWSDWKEVVQAYGVPTAFGLRFLSNLGRSLLIPFAPLIVATLLPADGPINTVTGLMVGVSSGAGTLTAVYLGRLGDNIGHRKILYGSALLAGLLFFPQTQVTSAWQLLVLQALTGAAAGGIIPAISALLAQYTHEGQEGSVYGLDNSITAGGRAAAPLLGSLVAVQFGLRATFTITGAIYLLVALLALWLLPKGTAVTSEPVDVSHSPSV